MRKLYEFGAYLTKKGACSAMKFVLAAEAK
jgi:hypothetical protein